MRSSSIMSNSAPAALAIAQDICKKNHFRIIIEKYVHLREHMENIAAFLSDFSNSK